MNFIRRKNITFREYLKKFGYTKKMVSRIILTSAGVLNEGLRKRLIMKHWLYTTQCSTVPKANRRILPSDIMTMAHGCL